MTARIYYTDPYCRRFEAVVTRAFEHEHRPAVLLDRTAFYPTSGGQPFDTGRLNRLEVVSTIEVDDDVVHLLSAPLAEGEPVVGEIDWARRFDHMQQHTGQHVLSAAFDRLFENRTIGFHMGAEVSTIDLARELSWDQISAAEELANRVVWEDREVAIRFVSPEHAATLPLRKEPAREGTLRLIDVRDFDLSACGGTHVARTGAVGAVLVPDIERFKGGVRVTFVCGGRAVAAFRALRECVAAGVGALSVSRTELPDAIQRTVAEAKNLRRGVKRLQESLAMHEAARLAADAARSNGIVTAALPDWDAAGLKAIASALTARASAAVVLLTTSEPFSIVVARSADRVLDSNRILCAITDRFGGRGGGKADLAQGGGLAGNIEEICSAARELLQ